MISIILSLRDKLDTREYYTPPPEPTKTMWTYLQEVQTVDRAFSNDS